MKKYYMEIEDNNGIKQYPLTEDQVLKLENLKDGQYAKVDYENHTVEICED